MEKVTIKDVAKEAGFGISVVSYVLNDTPGKSIPEVTRKKVFDAVKKLGYVPNQFASGMRTNKSMSIGVVNYWQLDDGKVIMDILKGVSQVSFERNYSVVLCDALNINDPFSYIRYFEQRRIDGIIFIAPHEADKIIDEKKHIEKMKNVKVPFVVINGHTNEKNTEYLNFNFYATTNKATRYLIDNGERDITYVAPLNNNYSEYQQRYDGYADAMEEYGYEKISCDIEDIGEKIDSFKAVVANKSDTAFKIIKKANELKIKIPDDFVLIAANTESYSPFLTPALSTVSIPNYEIGEAAAFKLLNLIGRTKENKLSSLECKLYIRESSC